MLLMPPKMMEAYSRIDRRQHYWCDCCKQHMYKLDRQLPQRQQEWSRPREIGVPSCLSEIVVRSLSGRCQVKVVCSSRRCCAGDDEGSLLGPSQCGRRGNNSGEWRNRHGFERFAVVLCPACLLKFVGDPVVIPRSRDPAAAGTRCAERPPVSSSSPYSYTLPASLSNRS